MFEIQQKLPPKFIFERENVDKTLKEQIYSHHNQIQIGESIMHGEGISISHIYCTQWESSS